jgi:uncharacterized repeat protein (TIGR01451 family)
MAGMFAQRRSVVGIGTVIVLALIAAVLSAADAAAQSSNASPSDERARFVGGNATECQHVGRGGDVQLKGDTGSASDAFVQGRVTGSGPTRLQVEITDAGRDAGVVIHAVVVKGSDGHNIYEDADVLPPRLEAPQNYISPRNRGGNIADISHWFVCYTFDEKQRPDEGTLIVIKRVERPVGEPVDPLPTRYRVRVECAEDGRVVAEGTFTFGDGGGVGEVDGETAMTGIPEGATCEVREVDAGALPDGCVVRYRPLAARRPGVRMRAERGRVLEVINDCQNVEVRRGGVQIVKRLVPPPPGVMLPDSFVADVECAYEEPVEVTMPSSGGPGTPRLDGIRAGADCFVSEQTGSLPPGMQVTYTINGSPSPVQGAASFTVVADSTVTVTITNDASGVPPPGCPSPPVDPPPPGCPGTVPSPSPPPPDLSTESRPTLDMDKTAARARVRAGGRVRYTIRLRDRGRGLARRVLVCDRLPRAMTLVSAPGARFRNGRVCWRISRLRPLASRRFTLTARAGRRASGRTTNVARADAPSARPVTARAQVMIRPRPQPAPDAVTG